MHKSTIFLAVIWLRVEQRNKETAKQFNALGLAEYEAMEGFVRYQFKS